MTIPTLNFVVSPEEAGLRLDRFVSTHSTELSRTRVQELIQAGLVVLNGKPGKDSQKVRANDVVEVTPTPRPAMKAEPERIPLEILYEDDDLIAVNKAAGMTVHAGAGNSRGTLVNALLGRGQALSQGGDPLRPGIVHRIDKETSGILLVAKNDFAHARLAESFRERTIQKTYLALVHGLLSEEGGRIELPIARDPVRRNRMTARRTASLQNARQARTDWRTLARIDSTTLVEVQLHTGRTHQIRVHFSALRHPIVGDTLYGASSQLHVADTSLPVLGRNFLHAAKLGFQQPRTGQRIQLTAPLPAELRSYLGKLVAAAGDSPSRFDAALKGFL
ncbi:MAG TPA: RluA family pseudouridine synthase [Candidatus Limnocylindrales bacterium]|nr:RluA family pseudouridine synthase [Candidatus Limnocylindrales bacterium]